VDCCNCLRGLPKCSFVQISRKPANRSYSLGQKRAVARRRYTAWQQRVVACCTMYQEQVSSAAAANRLHRRGLEIAESWRLDLRSSRTQNMPVDTALRKTRAPSAKITTNSHRYNQHELIAE